jgi:hypothetical protein
MQKNAIAFGEQATSAGVLAEKLKVLAENERNGVNTSTDYYAIMQQINKEFPDQLSKFEKADYHTYESVRIFLDKFEKEIRPIRLNNDK